MKSKFTSCGESIRWTFRGASNCGCSCKIWGEPISRIQGYLGSHISTYFKALVWLLKINLICMVLGLVLIVFPSSYVKSSTNDTTEYNRDSLCYNTDIVHGQGKTARVLNSIIQFFTGQCFVLLVINLLLFTIDVTNWRQLLLTEICDSFYYDIIVPHPTF